MSSEVKRKPCVYGAGNVGAPTGNRALIAVAWCLGIGLVGYLWSRAAYNRSANQ
jgi:hypothetical protein